VQSPEVEFKGNDVERSLLDDGIKTALVTGAAGFLGSHLVDRLLSVGLNVIGVDNLQTGSLANLAHLKHDSRFKFFEHDVVAPLDHDAQLIFNLACPASPVHYQADPIRTMKTSVIGALNLLELAERKQARYMQASTSEVYGDPHQHPQREDYWGHVNPIGIRACYDEGKRAAETLCFDFLRAQRADVRVVRIFNTYGPRMDQKDGRVVSNFIVQALKGEPITMYGDGEQTRSFCYVDDLISGFMALVSAQNNPGMPINMGNPGEFTMKELAELVVELTRSTSKIIYLPLPQDDPKQRKPGISKARSVLGWEPHIALRDGLLRTIEYFKSV
jgi:UDP-glucuronate decarboxylase